MKLTERKQAPGLALTDIVHVVLTNDTSQDPKGSSYNAEIGQIIGLVSEEIHVTGLTFNPANYDLSINNSDNTSYTKSLSILATDMTVTGGTYDKNTGTITFINNSGGTFNVSGFTTGMTETYNNDTGTTERVGGILQGSTFTNQTMAQMWDALLYPYQTPAFTSFARGNLLTEYDLGRPVLAGSQTFTWGTSNSGNIQANTIKIDQLYPTTVNLLTGGANDATETINLTGAIISTDTPTTISMYRITATNSKSITFTTTISRTWKYRWYYGKNINASLTNEQIIALANTNLITAAVNVSLTFPSSVSPEYLYIIIPQDLGQPSDWRDSTTGCFGNNIPYSNIGSTTIINTYGISTIYNIYRSTNKITGSQYVWLCS
jgi:hypothetical protein